MRSLHRNLAILVALVVAGDGYGSEGARIVGESRRTAQRFAEAAQLERDGRIESALDSYVRILNENGGDLVSSDGASHHLLPARWLAHGRIAANDRLLREFRVRIGNQAKKLLADGIQARDPKLLQQLVDTMFCARETAAALHLLGDLACERGDFATAQRHWMKLARGSPTSALAYPSADDSPLPHAKIVLSRWLAGELDAPSDAIAKLERQYPNSIVTLAGRTGKVGDILKELTSARRIAIDATAETAVRTPTTSGDETRNGHLHFPLPFPEPEIRCAPIALPDSSASQSAAVQRTRLTANDLATLPVVVRNYALVSDGRRISAFDLASGRLSAQFDPKTVVGALPRIPLAAANQGDAQFTLTVVGNDVYARLGQQYVRSDRQNADSYIIALRFQPNTEEPLRLRWILPAMRPDQSDPTIFEGPPVIHDGRLFVAVTRFDGNRAMTSVACYDPSGSTPQLVWQHDVLEAGPDAADRSRHLLLCAAEGIIVCGPYCGAIVALDAATGQRLWAHRYPENVTASTANAPVPRKLNPCVAAEGKVFAAPDRLDRMLALDLSTGALSWESDPIEVAHILGVSAGEVVCQTGGLVAGVRAIDAATGRLRLDWGFAVFGSDGGAPLGRGLLFDDCVCWPTRADGIKVLRRNGAPEMTPAVFHSIPGGNMAFGEGRLVIATDSRLHVLEMTPMKRPTANRETP